jgi:CRISPR-associated protein (TIGR03986 family)
VLSERWRTLIADYRAARRDKDIRGRRRQDGTVADPDEWLGREPGRTAWSPHLYDDSYLELRPGQLCYALLDGDKPVGLYPVIVARQLFTRSPADLLHPAGRPDPLLRPARTLAELSPADRVFGWVRDGGHGAYRGHLRIGRVTCDQGPDAVDSDPARFGPDGVPLAILAGPKPQQGRFYLSAPGKAAEPMPAQAPKEEWYRGQYLRGRKFYWHHAGTGPDYWANPGEDRTQTLVDHRFQEYRRPREERDDGALTPDGTAFATTEAERCDDQNCSIRGWVKPGATFRFTIDVDNLSDIELGALAWLLRLPADHHLKLGHGKPLGFGSVTLAVDPAGTDLRRTDDWVEHYRSLTPPPAPSGDANLPDLNDLAAAFAAAAPAPVLDAFCAIAKGRPDLRVHYPRTRPQDKRDQSKTMREGVAVPPDPRGRAYTWFVANERIAGRGVVEGRSLPSPAAADPSLPVY